MAETQISAFISESTKELVDRYVYAHGVKKGHLIEEALLHHLQALRELPADLIIPPSIELTDESARMVIAMMESEEGPTPAMLDFMAGRPVEGEP